MFLSYLFFCARDNGWISWYDEASESFLMKNSLTNATTSEFYVENVNIHKIMYNLEYCSLQKASIFSLLHDERFYVYYHLPFFSQSFNDSSRELKHISDLALASNCSFVLILDGVNRKLYKSFLGNEVTLLKSLDSLIAPVSILISRDSEDVYIADHGSSFFWRLPISGVSFIFFDVLFLIIPLKIAGGVGIITFSRRSFCGTQ